MILSSDIIVLSISRLQPGDRVIANGTKKGTVRYLGSVDFAAGTFVGLELVESIGKNDGSKFGRRYAFV